MHQEVTNSFCVPLSRYDFRFDESFFACAQSTITQSSLLSKLIYLWLGQAQKNRPPNLHRLRKHLNKRMMRHFLDLLVALQNCWSQPNIPAKSNLLSYKLPENVPRMQMRDIKYLVTNLQLYSCLASA